MEAEANSVCGVAIIIPCYNAAPYVGRALDSIFAQTYRDFRAYVIDDGSIDDLDSVLRVFAGRIVWSKQPHAGQAAARNRGIRLSRSRYVAFLDADDEWLPTKLEQQVEILQRAPHIGMVYSDCTTSGTGKLAGSFFARTGIPAGGRVFERFVENCGVYTPTVMVRRECLEDVGLFKESLPVAEDYNLWLRIAARWDIAVIPDVLAIRHITPGSLSATTSVERVSRAVIAAFEDVMHVCPDLRPHERRALRQAISKRYYAYGSYLLEKGNRRQSQEQLLQAMRYRLWDWRTLAKLALGLLPHRAFAWLRKKRQGSRGVNTTKGLADGGQ